MTEWQHVVDLKEVFWSDEPFTSKQSKIVHAIGEQLPESSELSDLLDLLSRAETVEEFDDIWDQFYDWADRERVWVSTF